MTRTMKKVVGFVLMVCMIVSLFAGVTSAFAAKAFKDVPDGHWAKTYVDFVVDKGYFAGVSEDKFDPDGKMTRAMFVAVIGKVEGRTFDNSVSSGYSDVPSGKYYTGAVKWATESKIVSGIGNNQYGPNLPITREQICVMMDKYIQYHDANNKEKYLDRDSSVQFKDASDIASWAKESVEKCVSYGLIQGYPDGKFLPKRNASRAEVAVMIYRLALYIEEETQPTEFKAQYKFASGTEGKKLDSKVEALLPSDANKYKDGDTVKAVNPAETTVMTDDGVWTFAGYDKKEAKVDKADVVFTGKWTFAEADKKEYTVEYKFVSGTKDVELPAQVSTFFLPKDTKTYLNGETVKAIDPSSKQYTTLQGRWEFVGYDKTEVKVNKANVVFTGTWERSPLIPDTYAVQYVFKTNDGKDVPAKVNDAKPAAQPRVANGTEVEAQAPRATSVIDGNDTWEFVSYDKQKAKVEGADVVFTGTWKKTATKKYKVTYKNTINSLGVTVPDSVKKELDSRLPAEKSYNNGERVTLETPVQGTYTSKEGTWTYVRTDPLAYSVTIEDKDVEVAWVWLLIPSRSYTVTYQYDYSEVGLTDRRAIRETLPTDDARYYTGDEAVILQPSSVRVVDSNRKGVFVFAGWDTEEENQKTVEIGTANVTLTGSWDYKPYYTVTYVNDPETVPVNVPKDTGKYIEGDKVTIKAPEKTSAEKDGKLYSYAGAFVDGKEVTSGTTNMPNKNLTIVHKWEEAEYSIVEFEAISATAGQSIPDEVKSVMPKPLSGQTKGSKVEGKKPDQTKVAVKEGYWVWQGYQEPYITVAKNVETFHGEWKFVKTYTATFEYAYADEASRTEGMPGAVIKTLPEDDNTLESGKVYNPPTPEAPEAKGWAFQGWTPTKIDAVSGDQKFVGKWKYTPTP